MSEYYTPPDDIVMFTKVKASQLNDLKDSVDIGFDNLPTDLSDLKQEVIDARGDKPNLISRLTAAEDATAADVISCQEEVSNCQAEVVNCQAKVINCQAEVVNCQAEVVNCQEEVSNCETQVENATRQAVLAAFYANNVVFNPEYASSSTTMTIGTGIKEFVTSTGKFFMAPMWVIILNITNPTQYMKGYINSYDTGSGAISVSVMQTSGAGNASSSWNVVHTAPALPSEYSPVSFKGMVMAEMF